MHEMDIPVSVMGIAEHYHPLIDGLVIDHKDKIMSSKMLSMGIAVQVTNTVMNCDSDKIQLAQDVVEFSQMISVKKDSL
jgi:hypothetical protein